MLIGLTTIALTYREASSPIACLFESVSACCNVGFSTGMTTQLSTQGKYIVLLAMLFGRVIPLAFLLRCLRVPLIQMAPTAPAQPVIQIELETPAVPDADQ
jgi:Trk-type K+ transport system membrane component